jgi:hypothetical protein
VLAGIGALAALLLGATSASATTYTVTNGNDSGAGSLRKAIQDAQDNGNEPAADLIQITFTGNITLDSFLPDITTSMTITGSGASNLQVRRPSSASTSYGIFLVDPAAGNIVTIEKLKITGGDTGVGGGITRSTGDGTLIVDSVVLSDNHSTNGGAIYYASGFNLIRNSTLRGNEAGFGGGILVDAGGEGALVNSTVTGNRAADFGGGVYVGAGAIDIRSTTIQGNTADSDDGSGGDGGGIYAGGLTGPRIANTLLAGNAVGSSNPVPRQCASAVDSFGYNLSETDDSGAGCNGFNATGDLVGRPGAALLGLLGGSGPTPTLALLAGNPAINAGNNQLGLGSGFPACPAKDQRGLPRGGSNGRCDIGAFEVQVPPSPPPTTTTPTPTTPTPLVVTPPTTFNLKRAIKKCKKKFPKGESRKITNKRKKCIRSAKRKAAALA